MPRSKAEPHRQDTAASGAADESSDDSLPPPPPPKRNKRGADRFWAGRRPVPLPLSVPEAAIVITTVEIPLACVPMLVCDGEMATALCSLDSSTYAALGGGDVSGDMQHRNSTRIIYVRDASSIWCELSDLASLLGCAAECCAAVSQLVFSGNACLVVNESGSGLGGKLVLHLCLLPIAVLPAQVSAATQRAVHKLLRDPAILSPATNAQVPARGADEQLLQRFPSRLRCRPAIPYPAAGAAGCDDSPAVRRAPVTEADVYAAARPLPGSLPPPQPLEELSGPLRAPGVVAAEEADAEGASAEGGPAGMPDTVAGSAEAAPTGEARARAVLRCSLMPHQRRALAWMRAREQGIAQDSVAGVLYTECAHSDAGGALHPLWGCAVGPVGSAFYVCPFEGGVSMSPVPPPTPVPPSGAPLPLPVAPCGILACEMGLGKTVTTLALVASTTHEDAARDATAAVGTVTTESCLHARRMAFLCMRRIPQSQILDAVAVGHGQWTPGALELFSAFVNTPAQPAAETELASAVCICGSPYMQPLSPEMQAAIALGYNGIRTIDRKTKKPVTVPITYERADNLRWVACGGCRRLQHAICAGQQNDIVHSASAVAVASFFLCPECECALLGGRPLASTTTVIVSPTNIVKQWCSEIERHAVIAGEDSFTADVGSNNNNRSALRVTCYAGVKATLAELRSVVSSGLPNASTAASELELYARRIARTLYPSFLARCDIVITTYDALSRDIDHSNNETCEMLRVGNALRDDSVTTDVVRDDGRRKMH